MNYSITIRGFINQQHKSESVNYEISDKLSNRLSLVEICFACLRKTKAPISNACIQNDQYFSCFAALIVECLHYSKIVLQYSNYHLCLRKLLQSRLVGNSEKQFFFVSGVQ